MYFTVWNWGLETTKNMDIHDLVSYMYIVTDVPHMVLCYHLNSVLTPLQAIGILIWYVVNEIVDNEEEKWYKFSRASLITVITEVM